MPKQGIPQEGLKGIACITMLLDHIGAVIVMACFQNTAIENKRALLDLYEFLRLIGRISFPIYCFLLVEGSVRTRDPKRYALRLLIAALLSEIPFDLAIYGAVTWLHQSVMVTLLLGLCALEVMKRCPNLPLQFLAVVPFAAVAEWLHADYGANGILVIALFALTRELPRKELWQFLGIWCIFSPNHLMMLNWIGRFSITMQEWAMLAVIPISLYDGRKIANHKAVQWGFYLFYPAHLVALHLIGRL